MDTVDNSKFGMAEADAEIARRAAALREKAQAIVDASWNEEVELKQMIAEERGRREEALRARAAEDGGNEGTGSAAAQGFPNKYHKIMVFKGAQAHDLDYVPVSVNGYAWKIRRGVQVIVPSVVSETLDHAVEEITIQAEGGIITRPNHRFPFQVIGEASEKEYTEFVAAIRAGADNAASMLRV